MDAKIGMVRFEYNLWPSNGMITLYAVGQCLIAGRVRFEKWHVLLPCLAFCNLGKSMGVKHTMLPDGQPETAAFNVLARLFDPTAKERVCAPHYSPKNVREGHSTLLTCSTCQTKIRCDLHDCDEVAFEITAEST